MPIHHLQLWVPDLPRAERSWGWLLGELGFEPARRWEHGQVWRHGALAIVIEASPDMVPGMLHSRWRPGMNHVAFSAGTAEHVSELVRLGPEHGWTQLDADTRHPLPAAMAVAFLEDSDGFEVELVADEASVG